MKTLLVTTDCSIGEFENLSFAMVYLIVTISEVILTILSSIVSPVHGQCKLKFYLIKKN